MVKYYIVHNTVKSRLSAEKNAVVYAPRRFTGKRQFKKVEFEFCRLMADQAVIKL